MVTKAIVSIALSPLAVSLPVGGTSQLTVTATYSDGSSQILTSGESFVTSNPGVATVTSTGMVTVTAGAAVGATAVISATDTASGDRSSTANSTVVTVSSSSTSGPPTATSAQAATATAQSNALCAAVEPFYWEIGDETAALVSGSVGTDTTGNQVLATTRLSIASASKWVYGTYYVQLIGGAANLSTTTDVPLLHFTSGYTNMPSGVGVSTCPAADDPDTVNTCLTLINPNNNQPYSYQNPDTIGVFFYDSAHLENHASLKGGLGPVLNQDLGTTVASELGLSINIVYSQPLMAGGIFTSSNDYTTILRAILSGALLMHDALGIYPACTVYVSSCSNKVALSPIPEAWHYSMAHWVEDDPATHGDGAFSSAGAYGFYPWIEAAKNYYGVISREDTSNAGTGEDNGYASAQCGRLIRHAWDTGVQQTGQIPE